MVGGAAPPIASVAAASAVGAPPVIACAFPLSPALPSAAPLPAVVASPLAPWPASESITVAAPAAAADAAAGGTAAAVARRSVGAKAAAHPATRPVPTAQHLAVPVCPRGTPPDSLQEYCGGPCTRLRGETAVGAVAYLLGGVKTRGGGRRGGHEGYNLHEHIKWILSLGCRVSKTNISKTNKAQN